MVDSGSALSSRRGRDRVIPRRYKVAAPEINHHERIARILIADDDPIFRDALRALLKQDTSCEVVGDSSDLGTALRLIRELRPDVVLLDWALSRHDGAGAFRELGVSGPSTRTVLLKVPFNSKDILHALECGASGIVLKNSTAEMLFKGIRSVAAGQYWVGHESLDSLVQTVRDLSVAGDGQVQKPVFGLTSREREIIEKVVAGYSNGEIASHFLLSEHTVKHHISNVFDKLGVSTRLELAFFAVNHKLTEHS